MNSSSPALTNPAGPVAADTAAVWWTLIIVAVVVFVIVMAFLLGGLFRRRGPLGQLEPRPAERPGGRGGLRVIVGGGIVIPAVVLVAVMVLTVRTMIAESAPARPASLTVEVVGHQYWWEVPTRRSGS